MNDSGLSVDRPREHAYLIEATGSRAEDPPANAHRIIAVLRDAFEFRRAKAVILRTNSAGASLVHVREAHASILRLRSKTDKCSYAFLDEQF